MCRVYTCAIALVIRFVTLLPVNVSTPAHMTDIRSGRVVALVLKLARRLQSTHPRVFSLKKKHPLTLKQSPAAGGLKIQCTCNGARDCVHNRAQNTEGYCFNHFKPYKPWLWTQVLASILLISVHALDPIVLHPSASLSHLRCYHVGAHDKTTPLDQANTPKGAFSSLSKLQAKAPLCTTPPASTLTSVCFYTTPAAH